MRPTLFTIRAIRAYSRPPRIWLTYGLDGAVRRLRREQRRSDERRTDSSVGRWC